MLTTTVSAACDAGAAILDLYREDVQVEYKEDRSPLTAADRASNRVITDALSGLGGIPILSEESRSIPYAERRHWERFWLVDPLDGTKEFLKRNGEFTVNIALVEGGRPILGVVYAPVLRTLYVGISGTGAFTAVEGEHFDSRESLVAALASPGSRMRQLPSEQALDDRLRVVASRSHQNDETREFIAELEASRGAVELVSIGSSLKLCLVAEGRADVYPRIAPTMEWDTAAAQAVVEASGGRVVSFPSGAPLAYNKDDLLNPFFVAYRSGWDAGSP